MHVPFKQGRQATCICSSRKVRNHCTSGLELTTRSKSVNFLCSPNILVVALSVVRPSVLHPFPGHKFVACSWIKISFGTNDRHNKTTCRSQNSGHNRQGHRGTLKQICFWAISLLFVVGLKYCLVQLIVITRQRVCTTFQLPP